MQISIHQSVLQKEVIDYLSPKPNENFIDCTIGQAGHAVAILDRNKPNGKILGIETDRELYRKLQAKIENRLILINDSYTNLKKIVKKIKLKPIHGILFDLGLSSWHLEESKRGFSFQKDEILDMRYNPQVQEISARDILNTWSESEIAEILRNYSEERFARKIAQKIIEQRKIKSINSTFQLVKIIEAAVPRWYCRSRRHFATKTFQALRIAVNSELENLKQVLPQAIEILGRKGRIAVISFHSLEDRIIKNFLREKSKEGLLKILTKKPVRPTLEEIKLNPCSRSAKLRAAVKICPGH